MTTDTAILDTATIDTAAPNPTAATVKRERQPWVKSTVRAITSFPLVNAAALVTAVFWICRNRIADPDLWWHLRDAQYFITNLQLPRIDTYTHTTPGLYWMNHEWLSELPYYGAYRALGLHGVYVLFAAGLATLTVAVFWLCMKESGDPLASTIASVVGILLQLVGFGPRTQIFGWLCFVAMFAVLLRFRSVRRAPLWLLPPVFCVWINLHGSWVFGMAVYAIFVFAGLVPRDIGRLVADPWSWHELKKLALTGLASAAALFVNPFGYRLVLFPIGVIYGATTAVAHGGGGISIEEFAPINFQAPRGKLVAAILGLIFVLILAGRKRWRIDNTLLTAFVVYGALNYIRLLFLAGIVLPPVLALHFGRISSYNGRREYRAFNAALLAIVLGWLAFSFPSSRNLQAQIADFFPVRALAYLRGNPQPGNMFNLYEWGGYLEWNLPEAPTFIDARGDIVDAEGRPADPFGDFAEVATLKNPQEILERFKVSYILYKANTPLAYYLSKVPQWERIYSDDQAVIYRAVRR
jgi:hypothetical protein